jgi:hypothetical protein
LSAALKRLLDPDEFTITPIADDPEYAAARSEVEAAEQRLTDAHARVDKARFLPEREEQAAVREVERLPPQLQAAAARLDEVAGKKSREICGRFQAAHRHYLEELVNYLNGASETFDCLASLHGQLAAGGYLICTDLLPANHIPPSNRTARRRTHHRRFANVCATTTPISVRPWPRRSSPTYPRLYVGPTCKCQCRPI